MALDQWATIAKRNKERMRATVAKATRSITANVIRQSPVLTGLFKNNWMVGINEKNTSTTRYVAKTATGEPGGAVLKRATATINGVKLGDIIHVSNSLPYAWRLEYGYSKKAPAGMVRVNAADWQGFVDRAARSVR